MPKGLDERDFGKKSVLRNPDIANLMQRIDYIEKMGTNINRIQTLMKKAGLPPVTYEFTSFVTAVFYRLSVKEIKSSEIGSEIGSEKSSEKILELMKENSHISASELASRIGISSRAVEKHISNLKEAGKLKRIGSAKSGHWEVME